METLRRGRQASIDNTGVETMQSEHMIEDGVLVVAQWEAKEGESDKIAEILKRFLPRAQAEHGVKLFLIGRGRENAAQFIFYELFADESAYATHQTSEHFRTLIAGEALPLLAKRERAQYVLI
jgi:quinol monooxygenase YgiN